MIGIETLDEFVIRKQDELPYAKGELSRLLRDIGLAAKIVNREVNKAGLVDILGTTGAINVQGEEVKKLDVYANKRFIAALKLGGECCGIASEENKDFIVIHDEISKNARYVVALDPLDGSSNIDVNVSVGTIFSIYRRASSGGTCILEDFLQKGSQQAAAGYIVYGSSTMLVYTTGHGVNGYIRYCKQEDKTTNRPYSLRYIGSMVADIHRNLISGGIFIYPATKDAPRGKLRLLYECNPMSFIVQQAGGRATDGFKRILDIEPKELHQRTPIFIGSEEMVLKAEEFMSDYPSA